MGLSNASIACSISPSSAIEARVKVEETSISDLYVSVEALEVSGCLLAVGAVSRCGGASS